MGSLLVVLRCVHGVLLSRPCPDCEAVRSQVRQLVENTCACPTCNDPAPRGLTREELDELVADTKRRELAMGPAPSWHHSAKGARP